jgi:hypothetical protein
MYPGPVVQVDQQQLEVEHDLVFLQQTFPAEGVSVDGIAGGLLLDQFGL